MGKNTRLREEKVPRIFTAMGYDEADPFANQESFLENIAKTEELYVLYGFIGVCIFALAVLIGVYYQYLRQSASSKTRVFTVHPVEKLNRRVDDEIVNGSRRSLYTAECK